METKRVLIGLAVIALLAMPAAATAQTTESNRSATEQPDATVDETAAWKETVDCSLAGPAEVQGYRIQCTNASFLDAQIADCCIPGDHWQAKLKNFDTAPNTAVTTSPGPANLFGVTARVYNYGGTATNPRNIDAYLECSYLHGVDSFGALSFIALSSDGVCTVTPDPIRSRIDRAP